MREMRVLIAILLVTGSLFAKAQNIDIGLALKGSTMGLGGDVIVGFNPKMDVRLGYETMGYSRDFSFKESDVEYDAVADVSTGTISALFDYYLTKSIFLTAGFGYNMCELDIAGQAASGLPWGDIVIPQDKIGEFDFKINPSMKISPYIGVGFGQPLSRDKKVAFAFEIGTYYQGSPNIKINTTGLLSPTMNPDQGQEKLLEYQISQYYLYPILKLNLSFKLASF
jgi:hypothetical protein